MRRLMRYVLTGGTAACVDLGGFVVLRALEVALLPAAAASFAAAAFVNFRLTARFVFSTAPTARRLLGFLAFALAGLAINTGVTLAVATLAALPDWIAKLAGIGVAFGFNYLANVLIVFRPARGA